MIFVKSSPSTNKDVRLEIFYNMATIQLEAKVAVLQPEGIQQVN